MGSSTRFAIFEANDWQIVEAADPAHTEPPALCYSSVWLSMNCLVLDPALNEVRKKGNRPRTVR